MKSRILALALVAASAVGITVAEAGRLKLPRLPSIKIKVDGKEFRFTPAPFPVPLPVPGILPNPIPIPRLPGELTVNGVPLLPNTSAGGISYDAAVACLKDVPRCPKQILSATGYSQIAPIVDAYRASLSLQAANKWQRLPQRFVAAAANLYPGVDLNGVRFATGINTVHGQAITIDNQIYFPGSLNLSMKDDVILMVHELEHVLQYARRGGAHAFLPEYLLKVIGKVIEKRSFDVHDFVDMERAAIAKADRYGEQVHFAINGGPVVIENRCREPVDLAILYLNKDNVWEMDAWYNFEPGEMDKIEDERGEIFAKSTQAFLYAHSKSFRWEGNKRYMTADGLPMREIAFERTASLEYKHVIRCDL